MRFSIIIPAYNAERYLSECLSSVSLQSFDNYEVILIDDGSTDSTLSLVEDFALRANNATVLTGENQGLLLARRRGLLHAKGEYVVFLDADDCLRYDALEILDKAIKKTDADIVSFLFSREKDFSGNGFNRDKLPEGLYNGAQFKLVKEYVCKGRFNNLCGKAIRLSCIDLDATYEAYKGLMHGEDLLQLLPIVDSCASLAQLDDVLYYYRPNESASTACYKSSQLVDIVQVNRRLVEYAARWGDACRSMAILGETNQYFYVLKLSELSDSDDREKEANFSSISAAMSQESVFSRARRESLRFDNRLLAIALEHNWRTLASVVVHFVEVLKWLP